MIEYPGDFLYPIGGKFGDINIWQKWMDKDFDEKNLTNE